MKVINTMIKPAFETHRKMLSTDVEMSHKQTDPIDEIIKLRDENADSLIAVSRKAASELKDSTFDLTRIYYLVDHPDQEATNQVFNKVFRPVNR